MGSPIGRRASRARRRGRRRRCAYFAGWAGRTRSSGETLPNPCRGAVLQLHAQGAGRGRRGDRARGTAPVSNAIWKIAPALAAGCTVVLKPRRGGARWHAAAPRRAGPRPGVPAGRRQHRHRRSARRSGAAPADAPGRRQGRVHRIDGGRAADHRAVGRRTSSASRWSWAASRRTSCFADADLDRGGRRGRARRCSPTRARSAARARGSSSSAASTTSSSSGCRRSRTACEVGDSLDPRDPDRARSSPASSWSG